MDQNTALSKIFQPIFTKNFHKNVSDTGADRYVKKLTSAKLIQIISFGILNQISSLREISLSLNDKKFSQAIELSSISHSQISRRIKCLSPELLDNLFKEATFQLSREVGFPKSQNQLGNLQIIDSTTISLCLSKSPWAVFRKTKSGVKVHLRLKFCDGISIPEQMTMTPAKVADRRQMDELIIEDPNALHIFDRGYNDYNQFDQFCEQKKRFLTRLKDNAVVETISEISIISGSPIIKESLVYLGNNQNKMKHLLRMIEILDDQGQCIRLITNDMTTSSEFLAETYRKRWQIELFFKWIKQHLTIKHLYGTSQRAVEVQLHLALILYCLLQLFKLKTGVNKSLLELSRILKICLFQPFSIFVKILHQGPNRVSKGRRKIDYEIIYQMTERQVMVDLDVDHLNDLTYDPIIL